MNLLRLTAKAPLAGMIPGLPIAETSVIDPEGAARPLPIRWPMFPATYVVKP